MSQMVDEVRAKESKKKAKVEQVKREGRQDTEKAVLHNIQIKGK